MTRSDHANSNHGDRTDNRYTGDPEQYVVEMTTGDRHVVEAASSRDALNVAEGKYMGRAKFVRRPEY